jgi:hypothetical protein
MTMLFPGFCLSLTKEVGSKEDERCNLYFSIFRPATCTSFSSLSQQREMTPDIEIQTLDRILLASILLFSFSSTPFAF